MDAEWEATSIGLEERNAFIFPGLWRTLDDQPTIGYTQIGNEVG